MDRLSITTRRATGIDPALTRRFAAAFKQTSEGIVEMARVAGEVRDGYGHGEMLQWLDREFRISASTANRLLRIHTNLLSSFNLTPCAIEQIAPSALYLLAAESTPAELRVEIVGEAERGRHVAHAAVHDRVRAAKVRSIELPRPAPRPDVTPPAPPRPTFKDRQPRSIALELSKHFGPEHLAALLVEIGTGLIEQDDAAPLVEAALSDLRRLLPVRQADG